MSYNNNILGRAKKFGGSNTYNPFANNQDLMNLSEQIFYIQNQNAFSDAPVICVPTGLMTNAVSFLNGDFTAKIIDTDGSVLVENLTPKITDIGKLIYPQINEIMWFDIMGSQGDYWIHEQWKGKILTINGDFKTTSINANEINQLTGIIAAWGGDINLIPERTLPCFGQAVSRYYYADLFEKIGTSWGNGDGTNTFNLPDGRDGVLKGVSGKVPEGMPTKVLTDPDAAGRFNNKGGNTGNDAGSYQRFASKTANKIGKFGGFVWMSTGIGVDVVDGIVTKRRVNNTCAAQNESGGIDNFFNTDVTITTDLSTANSTRDNNLGVNFIIFI